MEIAELCKIINHIFLSLEKHISNMAGEQTLAEPKLKVTP